MLVKELIAGAENGIRLTEDDTNFLGASYTIREFLDGSEEENHPEP